MAGIKLTHVPYKGVQQSIPDLISGQVSMLFDNIMTAQPHIKAGKVRALAISSPKRSPLVPDVPTVAESGLPGFQSVTWFGVLGPANTPKAVVERMNAEVNRALAAPGDPGALRADGLRAGRRHGGRVRADDRSATRRSGRR